MNILCLIFFAFLMIFGIVNVTEYAIVKLFFETQKIPPKEIIIPVYGHCENLEFIVRKIMVKYSWTQKSRRTKIIFINNGADRETLEICERFARSGRGTFVLKNKFQQFSRYH